MWIQTINIFPYPRKNVYLLKRCLSTLRLPLLDLSNCYTNSNNNTCLSKNRSCRVESEKWFTGVNYRNCGINHDLLIKQWDIKDLLVKLWDRTRTRLIQYSLILLDIQLTPAKSEKISLKASYFLSQLFFSVTFPMFFVKIPLHKKREVSSQTFQS